MGVAQKLKFAWFRKHKVVSAVLLVVVLLIVLGLYQGYAERKNRQAFKQARAAIDTVYSDIVAKVGPPDNSKRTNDCSRPNREFEEGPLSCDVGIRFIYGVSDRNEGDSLFKKMQSLVASRTSKFKQTSPRAPSLKDTLVVNQNYHSAIDYYESGGLDCAIKYVYDTPREIDLKIKDKSKKPLQTNIDCSGPAKFQYYPLQI